MSAPTVPVRPSSGRDDNLHGQSAQVIRDAIIGYDSAVWTNVILRGDVKSIRVGRQTYTKGV